MIVCKALFMVLLSVAFAFFFVYVITDRMPAYSTGESVKLEDWRVVTDGVEFAVQDPYGEDPEYGVPFRITTTLPADIPVEKELLFLYVNDTEVRVDGELRASFSMKPVMGILGAPVKATCVMVPIHPSDAGKELSILRKRDDLERRIYPTAVLGTTADNYQYLMDVYGTSFIMFMILFAVSILVIMAGIILRVWLKSPIDMVYAGLAVLVTTAWMMADSYLFPIVCRHLYIDGPLSYLLAILLPMPFLIYLNALQKRRYEKWYFGMLLVSLFSFFLWPILHFSHILSFHHALPFVDGVIGADIVICIGLTVYDILHGHYQEYKYTAIGFIGFAVCGFLQIIVIFTMSLNNDGLILLAGLLFMLALVVIQQLEELRSADEEKRHAMELSDAKTKFLANMSHEIRTPINSILGMNEMILRENQDETINEYARNVQNAGKMLLALINDVLDFSKIEAGKLEIANADYSLSVLLHDIILLMKERAGAKGLSFETDVAENVPDGLCSDEVRIKQILINLLTNAVKYTERGSVKLAVSGQYDSDETYRLCFEVRDTGKGIRDEDQAGLFDAFTRADLAKNRSVEGTGLGLAIVKSIVDSMHGEIRVRSEYEKGSAFTVILPQLVKDASPVSTDPDVLEGLKRKKTYHSSFTAPHAKILAVDDNAANLSIVRQFLKNTQVILDCCMSGDDALLRCTEEKYDLILLDHMMPDPDGIVTLARIRTSDRSLNRDTKAVVLTANAVAGSRQIYLDAGFVDYLTKPLNSELFEQTVRRYLPEDKVIEEMEPEEDEVLSFEEAEPEKEADVTENKWTRIGLDYEAALDYCGDAEVVELVISQIVADHGDRLREMANAVNEHDLETYGLHAHAIKSNLATLGLPEMSNRAKKHEFAAKDANMDFIREDYEAFAKAYKELCSKLDETLHEEE